MLRWARLELLCAFVVVAMCASLTVSQASAAEDSASVGVGANAVTAWAASAVGQQQGECFPWVRRVVQSVLGVTIGNDYRLGYLQAGAVEVTPQAARAGDIIQIAKDADTSPFADYAGLHTALVIDNQGGGKFRVVDSNSNFDGIVRIRDGYDPGAAAARYPGLSFHVYRLPDRSPTLSTSPTAPSGAPPALTVSTPGNLSIGGGAEVAADGDCLRVRSIAGLSGAILGCLPTGMRVTVTQPGPEVDGYRWVGISNGAIAGWASERYLRPMGAPTNGLVSETAPAPAPTPRIVNGVIPPRGIGLIVFSGGTDAELLAASGCPAETASFWTFQNDRFVQLLPGVPIPIVNAEWRSTFPDGIPASTPLMGRCRPLEPSSSPEPAAAAPPPIPATTPAAIPTVAPAPPATSAAPSTYVVVEGDSLSAIAERFRRPEVSIGAFLDALYAANGLTAESVLRLGLVLRLPS